MDPAAIPGNMNCFWSLRRSPRYGTRSVGKGKKASEWACGSKYLETMHLADPLPVTQLSYTSQHVKRSIVPLEVYCTKTRRPTAGYQVKPFTNTPSTTDESRPLNKRNQRRHWIRISSRIRVSPLSGRQEHVSQFSRRCEVEVICCRLPYGFDGYLTSHSVSLGHLIRSTKSLPTSETPTSNLRRKTRHPISNTNSTTKRCDSVVNKRASAAKRTSCSQSLHLVPDQHPPKILQSPESSSYKLNTSETRPTRHTTRHYHTQATRP